MSLQDFANKLCRCRCSYLEAHNLMPTMQSAYRKHHSTETTLLRVTNDILTAIDRRQDVVLVLLDLSAAFDTIDHTILVERLESYFAFSKQTLSWFRSYLAVTLIKNLPLTYHINETCKKATNSIRSIGRIRKFLTKENLKLLVNALVISRLDYCNSILYRLPKQELDKLQRIQNTAAQLITGTKHYEHITPALRELHWLPIELLITFKLLLITFKIIHGHGKRIEFYKCALKTLLIYYYYGNLRVK